MANSWLRLLHDMPNDPKWRTIDRVSNQSIALVQAIYLQLLVTPKENGKEITGLWLRVASIGNDEYRSRNALIRRHIDKLDMTYGAGTENFSLESVGDIDSMDDLLMQNCAQFLLRGWEGVGEMVDGKAVAIEYTLEKGVAMLKQKPELGNATNLLI